jgi:hypothetical protein
MGIFLRFPWLLAMPACLCGVVDGAGLRDGHVSEVHRDVRIETSGHVFVAKPNREFSEGLIRTAHDSRAEISFGDKSVVRVGDNTVMNVDPKARMFELQSGAMLTQVPSRVGATFVKVRHVIATATGTTLAVECLPNAYIKFISLDGTSRLCLKRGAWASECVLLRTGQMIITSPDPKSLPEAVDVDLNPLLATCQFITAFRPLPAHDRLLKAAADQRERKSKGSFAETNLVIHGRGTLVSQRNTPPATAPNANAQPSASPAPSPQRNQSPPP